MLVCILCRSGTVSTGHMLLPKQVRLKSNALCTCNVLAAATSVFRKKNASQAAKDFIVRGMPRLQLAHDCAGGDCLDAHVLVLIDNLKADETTASHRACKALVWQNVHYALDCCGRLAIEAEEQRCLARLHIQVHIIL